MFQFRVFRTFLYPFLFFVFLSCGDYVHITPNSNIYKVTVYVGNQTLDQGGLVRSHTNLRPAFLSSVAADPDVQGLSVILKDLSGSDKTDEIIYSKSELNTRAERILVSSLDSTLPTFTLPPDIPIGPYNLVIKVLGVDGVLSEKSLPLYYLSDAVFSIQGIHSFPPGIKPSTSPLFPPGIQLLLEGLVSADIRLDPYVIWYEGSRIVKRGRLAEQANFLLWQTPDAEGFQTLRFELYPENPGESKDQNRIPYISSSLRIAISNMAPIPGLNPDLGPFTTWFRFLGTLTAEATESGPVPVLKKPGTPNTLWLPGDDNYGLAVGFAHRYIVTDPLIPISNGTIQRAQIFLRYAPYSRHGSGPILFARFNNQNETDAPLDLTLSLEAGTLIIKATSKDEQVQAAIPNQNQTERTFSLLQLNIEQKEENILISIPDNPSKPLLQVQLPDNFSCSDAGFYGFGRLETETSGLPPDQAMIPNDPMLLDMFETLPQLQVAGPDPIVAIIDEFAIKPITSEE